MPSIEDVAGKYKSLRFNCIAEALGDLVSQAESNEISYLQFAEMLSDHELAMRDKNRIRLNLRRALFPVLKRLEEFDYRWQTTVTKRQINRLLDFSFVDNRENIVFIGPPGLGKTHLASGIGLKAIEAGYKVILP
jgi:DNA replication protein DnaC